MVNMKLVNASCIQKYNNSIIDKCFLLCLKNII